MAYDLEEQEQIASIKAWWSQFGNLITWLLTMGLAAYSAWAGWNYYVRTQSNKASQLYEELQRAAAAKDAAKASRAAVDMEEKFSRTAYAQMGALAVAKAAFDANDLKLAKAQLQWVVENGIDVEYKDIAKIRMAGILLDEKSYDEALKLVDGEFPISYAGLVADRKGDILVAQSKFSEAIIAYQNALDKIDQKGQSRQMIQLKLDAIASGSAEIAIKPAA